MKKRNPLLISLKKSAEKFKREAPELARQRTRHEQFLEDQEMARRLAPKTKDEAFAQWSVDNGIDHVDALSKGAGNMNKLQQHVTTNSASQQMGYPNAEQTGVIRERAVAMREIDKLVDDIQRVFGDVIYEMDGEFFCPVCMESKSSSDYARGIDHKPDCSLGALIDRVEHHRYRDGQRYPLKTSQWEQQYRSQQHQYTKEQYAKGLLGGQALKQAQVAQNKMYTQMTQQNINSQSVYEALSRYGSASIGGPPATAEEMAKFFETVSGDGKS